MKRSVVFVTLCCVMMVAFWSASAAPTNFAGTWHLDKAKSEGLQYGMADLDQTWVVTQDAKTLTVEALYGGQPAVPPQKNTYNLDGSETSIEIAGPTPVKTTLKAKWQGDGSILELNSVFKTSTQGNDVAITRTEHWELADGGKTLKVHRTQETPRGTQETKLMFARK